MKTIKNALRKFFLIDILEGLWVTLRHYFGPKSTIPYPEKVQKLPERFRGTLRLFKNAKGEPLCIACKACQRICPTKCFEIQGERDPASRIMHPVQFNWKLDRCTFCGLCVEVCPTDAIRFSLEFRMSTFEKDRLLFHLADMYLAGKDMQKYFGGEAHL